MLPQILGYEFSTDVEAVEAAVTHVKPGDRISVMPLAYFHKCLNFAAVRKLPVVYVCENNEYSEFTRTAAVTAGPSLAGRGSAYGIPGVEVDSNDVLAVKEVATQAITRAREAERPSLIKCRTYRHKGHSRHDDPRRYRPPGELDSWLERDPSRTDRAAPPTRDCGKDHTPGRRRSASAVAAARAALMPDPAKRASSTKEPSRDLDA